MFFPALITSFPDIEFINEEATGCIDEEAVGAIYEVAKGAIIGARNLPSYFFISCFNVSIALSINGPEFYSDFTILIILSISSFEMNKVNIFFDLTATLLLIFISNLFDTEKISLVTNLGKTSWVKGTARSIGIMYIMLPNILLRNYLMKWF